MIASSGGSGTSSGSVRPCVDAGIEQLGQFILIETEQFAIETDCLQLADFDRQQVEVPLGVLAGAVVGDPVGPDRFGLHVLGDVNRDFGKVQLLGGFQSRMADDDDAVGIDDDRLPETEFVDGLHDRDQPRHH